VLAAVLAAVVGAVDAAVDGAVDAPLLEHAASSSDARSTNTPRRRGVEIVTR
jgi:hypothetical protein